jgi:hypothetical protein
VDKSVDQTWGGVLSIGAARFFLPLPEIWANIQPIDFIGKNGK